MGKTIFQKAVFRFAMAVYEHDEDEKWMKRYGWLFDIANKLEHIADRKEERQYVIELIRQR